MNSVYFIVNIHTFYYLCNSHSWCHFAAVFFFFFFSEDTFSHLRISTRATRRKDGLFAIEHKKGSDAETKV